MKFLVLFNLLWTIALCSFSQKGQTAAIKIYVKDAETEKKVKGAKVMLEGYEISPIKARYSKRKGYYYFDAIPSGYNTVMVYHKKYNEKGFQDTNGLPKELTFKLATPFRVTIANDTNNYYKEDNQTLAVLFNDTLHNTWLECAAYSHADLCFVKQYFEQHYPELLLKGRFSSYNPLGMFFYYFVKKNKENFKRFNDPVIGKLNNDKHILMVFQFLLKTKVKGLPYIGEKEYFYADGRPNYLPNYVKYINYDTSVNVNKMRNGRSPLLAYKELLRKGLLKNNVYQLSKSELEKQYKPQEEVLRSTGLYHYEIDSDTAISNYVIFNGPRTPVIRDEILPYILISNSLFNPTIYMDTDKKNIHKWIIYANYGGLRPKEPTYDKNLIFNTRITGKSLYQFKQNASPSGTIDLIAYYSIMGKQITQTRINHISND